MDGETGPPSRTGIEKRGCIFDDRHCDMTGTASPFTKRVSDILPVLSILAIALALRVPLLDRPSLWYDEAVTWSQSNGSLGHLFATVAADNHPPLHHLLLWLWIPLFGDSESALRSPSLIAGIAAVWLLYVLGKELGGRRAGLAAAFLLAISPFHIWYSAEARMYAVFAAAGLAFFYCLIRCLKTGSPGAMLLTAVLGALFLYSHVYAAFAFAAVGAMLLIGLLRYRMSAPQGPDQRARLVRSLAALAISGAAFLPWLLVLLQRAGDVASKGFWIADPGLAFLTVMARDMAGTATVFVLFLALAIAALAMPVLRRQEGEANDGEPDLPLWLLAAYTFGPAIIGYLASVFVQPILFDRYLIAAWPGLLLLAAIGASRIAGNAGAVLICAATLVLTLQPLQHTLFHKLKPEWREIAETFLSERQTGDKIHLFKGFAEPALTYYLRGQARIIPLEDPVLPPATETTQTLWLLVVHTNDKKVAEILKSVPEDFTETGTWQRFGWGQSGLTLSRHDRQ